MNEKIIQGLKGKTITQFYRTIEPERTMWHGDGLGMLAWYKIIVETDDSKKYLLGEDYMEDWNENQKLIEFTPKPSEQYSHKVVTDIMVNKEYEQLFIILANNTAIYLETCFGSEVVIDKKDKVFDEFEKLR